MYASYVPMQEEKIGNDFFFKYTFPLKVTMLHLVPPMALMISKHPHIAKYDLSSVQDAFCGAAPLGRESAEEFMQTLNIKSFRQGILEEVSLKCVIYRYTAQ